MTTTKRVQVISKWDARFLELAEHIAKWSKDPSTQVGAVIADVNRRVVSLGFNGLPVRVQDHPSRLENRERKLAMVVHAEMNAILFSDRALFGCTLYTWPFAPCSHCAAAIIQTGIKRVVTPAHNDGHRWADSIDITALMFTEAHVEMVLVDAA